MSLQIKSVELPQRHDSHGEKENGGAGDSFSLQRMLVATIRAPVTAWRHFFRTRPVSTSRRAILLGRFREFVPSSRLPPLLSRVPCSDQRRPPSPQPRSIGGINIDPVPPTDLENRPVVRSIPVHRPPGAIEESQFLAGCSRCADCIRACPYDAIVSAPDRLGNVAGTPIILADESACMMCEGFPCITACQPGVLTGTLPPIMGTAQVTQHLCLAHHHTTCTVCSERCPVENAIAVANGIPTVNESYCTGCGVCRYVCPAPENAILLLPAFTRPRVTRS